MRSNLKKKLSRWLLPLLLAFVATFLLVTPILAIEPPDDIEINAIYVYRNCRQEGDQLYLVEYTIENTENPDETATIAYMCRLREEDDSLAVSYPYAFYNDGYGSGVVAFYFTATSAPEWDGPYSVQLLGNIFLDWEGVLPDITESTFDLWQDTSMTTTKIVLASRVLTMAQALETEWGIDLVAENADTGQIALTAYGVAYFSVVIPYFTDVAPNAMVAGTIGTSVTEPQIDEIATDHDYADDLDAAIDDTLFDLSATAEAFGVDRGPFTALLYYGVVLVLLIMVSHRLESQKPLLLLSIPAVIGGAFVGVPLVVTILVGFLALLYIAYSIFYKPSPA